MSGTDTFEQRKAQLMQWIDECPKGRMVFLGGAGVSTESGIPDFRSADGLYNQKAPYPPEVMLSRTFFDEHTRDFFDYYVSILPLDAKPNRAHIKLGQLEKAGKLSAVITQNFDDLHQAGGSESVYELHGSMMRNYCMKCGKFHGLSDFLDAYHASADGIPRCECGGIVKPDVVLYEESLDSDVLTGSVLAIQKAELMIIAGTSLAVYPAAGLVDYFRGKHLVIINMTPTPADQRADLCIAGSVGDALDF